MSDETGVEPRPQTAPTTTNQSIASTSPPSELNSKDLYWNRGVYSGIMLCSLALIGCFFLPWIRILAQLSGYDVQQVSKEAKFVWLVPVTAFICLLASLTRQSVIAAASFAGIMPFLILAIYGAKFGKDLMQILQVGAYLSMVLGALLIVLSNFIKIPKP